jgi:hypothetical protein
VEEDVDCQEEEEEEEERSRESWRPSRSALASRPRALHRSRKSELSCRPARPAARVRRSGAAAATQATVHAWVQARVPMHYV